ncbi:MAG TPA: hypothetical protein VEK34_03565 [Methylocella sp.]|nr:hypothetical protein [Methylocella sp.]
MKKSAVLILTHFVNQNIIDLFHRLRAESPAGYDIFVVMNLGEGEIARPDGAEALGNSLYLTNHAKLLSLPYPEKCKREGWSGKGWDFNDGNPDVLELIFFLEHSEYDYYWIVEYDVHYEGRWNVLFERFSRSRADFLATMVNDATADPKKLNWIPPLRDEKGQKPSPDEAIISFMPLHRISRRLLIALDDAYKQGWGGHHEFVPGTLAKRLEYEIEDIGGTGPYAKPHNKNVFYFGNLKRWDFSPGTFVFRPSFKRARKYPDTLWHPVKPAGGFFNHHPSKKATTPYGWAKSIRKFVYFNLSITLWFMFRWRPLVSSPIPEGAYDLKAYEKPHREGARKMA